MDYNLFVLYTRPSTLAPIRVNTQVFEIHNKIRAIANNQNSYLFLYPNLKYSNRILIQIHDYVYELLL